MTIIAISGGFDPIHKGHIDLIEGIKNAFVLHLCPHCGESKIRIHVYLNTDEWLIRKKGYCFMPFEERAAVLLTMRNIEMVIPVIDTDDTVCETIKTFKPDYFINGGDRTAQNTPELKTCMDLRIPTMFGIGGKKVQSSSELVKKVKDAV